MTVTAGAAKQGLRERSRLIRDAIDPIQRVERSEAVYENLFELEPFRDAETVAIYFSSGSEVHTGSLAIRLAELEGKRLMLPFDLNGELQLTDWRPSDPVVDAAYGGLEPRYRRAVPLEAVEAIVVPGVAFDRRCLRLGQGRGLVDGLLRRLGPGAIRIGLAFDEQIVPSVPTEPGDERVHAVATDSELIVPAEAFVTERVR